MTKTDLSIIEEEFPNSEHLYYLIVSIIEYAEIYSLDPKKSPLRFIYDHSKVKNIDKCLISNLNWPLAIKIVIISQLFEKSEVIH